jgi:hypothetical protein
VNENPYQAPSVEEVVAPAAPSSEAEAIRSKHLKHEASLKAVGFLFYLGAAFSVVSVVAMVAVLGQVRTQSESPADSRQWMITTVGARVAICVAQVAAGWGLRRLRSWGKFPAGVLVAISLFRMYPIVTIFNVIGTLFGAYILYLLFCAKGRMVLSPAYAEIVAQTPHLRYRTPLWIWIVLILFVLLILALAILSNGAG